MKCQITSDSSKHERHQINFATDRHSQRMGVVYSRTSLSLLRKKQEEIGIFSHATKEVFLIMKDYINNLRRAQLIPKIVTPTLST